MDGSFARNLNFGPLMWLAGIGVVALVLGGALVLVGGGWWVVHHVTIVW